MSDRLPVRALIVDDEPLARQRLEDLLSRQDHVEIVGRIDNGIEAVRAIRDSRPDLVFLDVQMPGMSGLEVVSKVGPENMPATIFTTAFHQHALKAFDLAALDYLVKPFDDERFEQAFRRARRMIELAKAPSQASPRYLERIAVETRGQVRVVAVEKIDYITASGPYAELHAGERTYAIRERMQTLEEQLDPSRFFRIHRSTIVQLDRIDALLHRGGGDYAVRLKDGLELSVSRARREELAGRIGVRPG